MTLEECYRALGGSYSDVLARLVDDKMITKYLNKFTKDTSYRVFSPHLKTMTMKRLFVRHIRLKVSALISDLKISTKPHIRSPRLCGRKRTKPLRKCWTS